MNIITGMHRSGTSLVTRLFCEAGADLGDPATLYPGDRWNPDGYFEQPAIHAINMPLINGPWGKFAYFALPSTATIMKRAARRAAQIKETAASFRHKVVKECRFCLTLPAWTEHGAHIDGLLVCLREPIAVARSLQKRNRITLKRGFNLWLLHNDRLLEHAQGLPLWFVSYSNLLDETRFYGEMKPAFAFFGIEVSDADLMALQRAYVKPQMNHNRPTTVSYPEEVRARWHDLLARHEKQSEGLLDAVEDKR